MNIRPLELSDGPALFAFVKAMPEEESAFFKSEQITSDNPEDWMINLEAARLVATDDQGGIVGYAAVLSGSGLSRHVGEVLLIVSPASRGTGVGRALARAAMVCGFADLGLSKLTVDVVADQEGPVHMFTKLGFTVEALLRDHLRDEAGRLKDMLVLSHLVDQSWSDLELLGIPQEL